MFYVTATTTIGGGHLAKQMLLSLNKAVNKGHRVVSLQVDGDELTTLIEILEAYVSSKSKQVK